MALIWPAKDPDEVLDYSWNIPVDDGDAVSSATLTRTDGTATIDSQSRDGAVLTAFISGGTDGEAVEFLARATTTGGRTFEETIYLPIQASDSDADFVGMFIAAFPAFAGVAPASIAFWKGQADLITVPLADCLGGRSDLATMLATAHYLCQQGLGTGTESQMAAEGMSGFKSIKSGTISLERFDASDSGMGEWGSTSYGARLWPMLKACLGGPRVTGTGRVVGGCGFNGFAGPLPPWGC